MCKYHDLVGHGVIIIHRKNIASLSAAGKNIYIFTLCCSVCLLLWCLNHGSDDPDGCLITSAAWCEGNPSSRSLARQASLHPGGLTRASLGLTLGLLTCTITGPGATWELTGSVCVSCKVRPYCGGLVLNLACCMSVYLFNILRILFIFIFYKPNPKNLICWFTPFYN